MSLANHLFTLTRQMPDNPKWRRMLNAYEATPEHERAALTFETLFERDSVVQAATVAKAAGVKLTVSGDMPQLGAPGRNELEVRMSLLARQSTVRLEGPFRTRAEHELAQREKDRIHEQACRELAEERRRREKEDGQALVRAAKTALASGQRDVVVNGRVVGRISKVDGRPLHMASFGRAVQAPGGMDTNIPSLNPARVVDDEDGPIDVSDLPGENEFAQVVNYLKEKMPGYKSSNWDEQHAIAAKMIREGKVVGKKMASRARRWR